MVTHISTAASAALATSQTSKAGKQLSSAASEFESVLLNQWLQGAESTFGAAPGGPDDDADSGGQQMQSFGTQQLANSLTASGGIGIARMVQSALARSQAQHGTATDTLMPSPSPSPSPSGPPAPAHSTGKGAPTAPEGDLQNLRMARQAAAAMQIYNGGGK